MKSPEEKNAGPTRNTAGETQPVKSLVVVFSCHHNNTEKIANVIANVLGAPVKTPREIIPEELAEYDLVGFGSGIYGAKNHGSILDLAGRLPDAHGRNAFIFSTFGAPEGLYQGDRLREFIRDNHSALRETLQARGYVVMDEFSCAGFNTNSFLRFFGGLNKGRPDADDLRLAEAFAENLKQRTIIGKN
ncbi:flavodoxin family protein [Methanoregula sp.]|uniref:flavodoxin family protein n=1 Tax=Methanoregula sp. TaxID=2052170 RepID=UPI0035617553